MSTTYPYGLNTGSTIPGVEQTGYIVKGISNQDYSSDYGGVKWWMGPDEELGYVITAHFPGLIDGQDTPTSENARIRFWRSPDFTEQSFLNIANTVAMRFGHSIFTNVNDAVSWLGEQGFPTTFIAPTPSLTPSRTPSVTRTPSRTPSISFSRTPSITPTISLSRTPTRTPSVSISRTPTRTPSISISRTPSITPTISASMSMDNRYWINGSGNWSDTSHWSYTSGGSGGAPAPTQNDNVYFDGNSFNTGFTVTLTAHSSCKNFNCTGLNQELTITASDRRLSIYGSVVLSPYLTTVFQSYTNFFSLAATTNETIRYNNAHIDQLRLIGSGSWTLLDTLNPAPNKSFEGSVIIEDGTLNTANQTIMTRYFTIYGGTFNAGSSTIYVSEILHIYDSCVFNCGTSHIIMDGVDQYFNGEGKTFYDVTIEGNGWTGAGAEIYGNNTFHNLILLRYNDDIPRVRFQAGSTQTITNAFSCNGTSSQTFYLEGVSNSTWYLVFSGSGIVSCNYLTINYSSASPANKWYAGPNSVQGTGVSGWIFSGGPTPSITPSISPSPTPGP